VAGSDSFSADESRKMAALIARTWANPALAADYQRDPQAVLSGAGVELGNRAAPAIPERPDELSAQPMAMAASGSSASSFSCASCPCTGCTASTACCAGAVAEQPATMLDTSHIDAIMKLAEDPAGRAQARQLMSQWDVKLALGGSAPTNAGSPT
jgi:hypothetical protein